MVCRAAAPAGGAPLVPQSYLIYTVGAGEGFNLQRNVFLRALSVLRSLPADVAARWSLVLSPFANAIHWEDRGIRPWRDFFDVGELRTLTPPGGFVELDAFLKKAAAAAAVVASEGGRAAESPLWAVEEAIHVTMRRSADDTDSDGGLVHSSESNPSLREDPRAPCGPENVTRDNSGWPQEFQAGAATVAAAAAAAAAGAATGNNPVSAKLLGHKFDVRHLRCVGVRWDLSVSGIVPLILDADRRGVRSLLIDHFDRVSWDVDAGERYAGYYHMLSHVTFAQPLVRVVQKIREAWGITVRDRE